MSDLLVGRIVDIPKSLGDKGEPSADRTYGLIVQFYLQDLKWPRVIVQTLTHLEAKGVARAEVAGYGGHLVERRVSDCKVPSSKTVEDFLGTRPS